MASDERETSSDQPNVKQIGHQEGKDRDVKSEKEDKSEKSAEIAGKVNSCSTGMSLISYHMSPERLIYGPSRSKLIGAKSKAETYVTRSLVHRCGPIVSPTISPTIPYETTISDAKSFVYNQIDYKRARDYEAAASICSMRDSVKSHDAMRVSKISTLFRPSLSASGEYTHSAIKHDGPYQGQLNGRRTPEKERASFKKGSCESAENATKDTSVNVVNSRDDTDHSDGENEDLPIIIMPRPEHENHDSATYGCRLPCCSRIGYRTSSPDTAPYSPIRVPAKRPGRYPSTSPPKSFSDSEQNGTFSRHQNGSKSAFTAVSPSKKRHDASPPYSSTPSVKVRVIQECSTENERVANGHFDAAMAKHMTGENSFFPKTSMQSNIKLENGGKIPISNRSSAKDLVKNDDFHSIKSALAKDVLCTKGSEGSKGVENKILANDAVFPQSTQAYLNGITPSLNGYNFAYNFAKGENVQHVAMVQCSTVDSTASDADSRLLDLARIANEQLGEEIAKQHPVTKRVKQKSNDCLHLWEFLRDILNNETMSPKAIEWTVKEKGEFRLIKTGIVAQLWGLSKNRTSMTYEKMARAMRYYYKMKILEKVPHKRLHFRFGKHMLPKVLVLPNGKKE